MVDSFFSKPGKKRTASSRRAKKPATNGKQQRPATNNNVNNNKHDDEISGSESSDNDDNDMTMEDAAGSAGSQDEEEEYANETAVDKRRRLAKQYIENIQQEEDGEEGELAAGFDAADLDRDIIARRLNEDVAEDQGKIYKYIAGKLNLSMVSPQEKTVRTHKLNSYGLTAVATKYPYAYTTSKDIQLVKWDISKLMNPRKVKLVRGRKAPDAGHSDEITCVAVSSDGKYVVTGGKDRKIVVWSTENLAVVKIFDTRDRNGVVTGLTFRRGTNELYASCSDLKVRTYNLDQLAQVEILFGHQDEVQDISALTQERCVTVGSRDRTAIIWKITEESRLTFRGGDTSALNNHRRKKKRRLNDGDDDADDEMADAEEPYEPVIEGSIDCCSMIDDQLFVTGSDNGNISLWSTNKKKPLYVEREGHGRDDPLTPSAASGETDPNTVKPPVPQPRYITSIHAIPYSDVFFTGSWSGNINIWKITEDHRKFQLLGSIDGVKGIVNKMSVEETGQRSKETYALYAAVSKEPRLGRWLKVKGGKNGLVSAVIHTQKK